MMKQIDCFAAVPYDSVKTDLKMTVCEDVDSSQLAQDTVKWQAFVNNIKEQSGYIKGCGYFGQLSNSQPLTDDCNDLGKFSFQK
jgi:hypothetical protein